MSDTNSKDVVEEPLQRLASATAFEALLSEAEVLLSRSDVEAALEQLLVLQEQYIAATRLFDLIGEAYLRGLDVRLGVKYKTLYEVLMSTLTAQRPVMPRGGMGGEPPQPSGRHGGVIGQTGTPEPGEPSPPTTHFTLAMGRELMRQGHFDKALEIYDTLMETHPQDEELLQARETARKKSRERRLLGVLERWLHNIEDMKSGRSRGA